MTCSSCSKDLNENDNFCSNCGVRIYTSLEIENQNTEKEQIDRKDTVSIKNWVGSFALIFIPYVGIFVYFIMLFVWGLSKNTNPVKRNFALAQLIMFVIVLAINVLLLGSYWSEMFKLMESTINVNTF